MGVAMMMQQAGVLVGAPAPAVDLSTLNGQIRKAKVRAAITIQNSALETLTVVI